MKEVDIYLFESTDGKRWKWRSKAASGMSSAGEEGANENDMVVAAGKEPKHPIMISSVRTGVQSRTPSEHGARHAISKRPCTLSLGDLAASHEHGRSAPYCCLPLARTWLCLDTDVRTTMTRSFLDGSLLIIYRTDGGDGWYALTLVHALNLTCTLLPDTEPHGHKVLYLAYADFLALRLV